MRRIRAIGCLIAAFSPAAFAECPVTLASSSPVIVPGMTFNGSYAWYGSESLAVLLPANGQWKGMGPERKFRDKFWIWRRGYDINLEPQPDLSVKGVKLDAGADPETMEAEVVNNAFGKGWSSMITALEFPSAGCWRLTADYEYAGISHELSFVLEVVTPPTA